MIENPSTWLFVQVCMWSLVSTIVDLLKMGMILVLSLVMGVFGHLKVWLVVVGDRAAALSLPDPTMCRWIVRAWDHFLIALSSQYLNPA
jgi:hypothetical protein